MPENFPENLYFFAVKSGGAIKILFFHKRQRRILSFFFSCNPESVSVEFFVLSGLLLLVGVFLVNQTE